VGFFPKHAHIVNHQWQNSQVTNTGPSGRVETTPVDFRLSLSEHNHQWSDGMGVDVPLYTMSDNKNAIRQSPLGGPHSELNHINGLIVKARIG